MNSKTMINTPIEVGLRTLVILNSLKPEYIDLDRLVIFDYLVIHIGDVFEDEVSLHPSTPRRSGELLVRRQLLQDGLTLMESRDLLNKEFTKEGIVYRANSLTEPFLKYFDSEYSSKLNFNAKKITSYFNSVPNQSLKKYVQNNLDIWGGEFANESFLRSDF